MIYIAREVIVVESIIVIINILELYSIDSHNYRVSLLRYMNAGPLTGLSGFYIQFGSVYCVWILCYYGNNR